MLGLVNLRLGAFSGVSSCRGMTDSFQMMRSRPSLCKCEVFTPRDGRPCFVSMVRRPGSATIAGARDWRNVGGAYQ